MNCSGMEKIRLLARICIQHECECRYLKTVKHHSTCLGFQKMEPKEKIIPHEIPLKPWEVTGADFFH